MSVTGPDLQRWRSPIAAKFSFYGNSSLGRLSHNKQEQGRCLGDVGREPMHGADKGTGEGRPLESHHRSCRQGWEPETHRRMPLKFFSLVLTFISKLFLFKSWVLTLGELWECLMRISVSLALDGLMDSEHLMLHLTYLLLFPYLCARAFVCLFWNLLRVLLNITLFHS